MRIRIGLVPRDGSGGSGTLARGLARSRSRGADRAGGRRGSPALPIPRRASPRKKRHVIPRHAIPPAERRCVVSCDLPRGKGPASPRVMLRRRRPPVVVQRFQADPDVSRRREADRGTPPKIRSVQTEREGVSRPKGGCAARSMVRRSGQSVVGRAATWARVQLWCRRECGRSSNGGKPRQRSPRPTVRRWER